MHLGALGAEQRELSGWFAGCFSDMSRFGAGGFNPAPLRAGHVPEPDLTKAEPWELRFNASEETDIPVVDDFGLPYL
ncbi:MAG: hypothetical protein ABL998_15200, partial [Planctomycetota bacterium]